MNTETLQAAIAALRALIIRNSKVVCDAGIDVDLFKLLDWTVASAYPLCTAPYWGVELRTGLSGVIDNTTSLQRSVELAIDAIVGIDVQQRPLEAPVKWILMCRPIALGVSGSSSKPDDDEDMVTATAGEDAIQNKVGFDASDGTSRFTYQQYAAWKRDKCAAKTASLSSSRCRLRCVALHCSTAAVLGSSRHLANVDLQLCRTEIQNSLDELPANPSESDLDSIPCYLSIFLQEIVNMACACASYTIEDNRQTALQAEAIDFLHVVVAMFWQSLDPDVLKTSPVEEGRFASKIMEVYIAQIISALRPCLSSRWCAALLWTAGGLICDLIRGGLLTDNTVIRRLLKVLITNCEIESETFSIRPLLSVEVAEEIGIISFVVNMTNLARVYLLGVDTGISREVSNDVKLTILNAISPLKSKLESVWEAMSWDGARLLQGQRRWVKATESTDPRRGGVTYGTTSEVSKIRSYYEYALPFTVSAISVEAKMFTSDKNKLSPIFFIIASILENLATLPNSQYEHKLSVRSTGSISQVGGMVRLSRSFIEPLLFADLARIAGQFSVVESSLQRYSCDDTSEWVRLLIFVCRDVIPHRSSSVINCAEYISLCCEITNVVTALHRPSCFSVKCSELGTVLGAEDLWMWSWISMLSLVSSFFPDIFGAHDNSSSFLSLCRQYASAEISDDGHQSCQSLHELLFPKLFSCPSGEAAQSTSDRTLAGVTTGCLENILHAIVSLSMRHNCAMSENFTTRLLVAISSRLNHCMGPSVVGGTRKQLLGLLAIHWKSTPGCSICGSETIVSDADRTAFRSDTILMEFPKWMEFYIDQGINVLDPKIINYKNVIETLFTSWILIFRDCSKVSCSHFEGGWYSDLTNYNVLFTGGVIRALTINLNAFDGLPH